MFCWLYLKKKLILWQILANWQKLIKRKKFDDFEKNKKSPQLGTQREETLHFV
jgi:hypothetical protein